MKVAPNDETRGSTPGRAERAQPAADGAAFKAALADESVKLRAGEKLEAVDGHRYGEIVAGKREGMYVNTGGNARHGEAFVLVRKHGVDYHIYGSGKDREVVAVGKPGAGAKEPEAAPETPAAEAPAAETPASEAPAAPRPVELGEGEKAEPVAGHAYSDIVSGDREGMYVNTSGNVRHGEAFVLVRKHGVEYHIYGSGSDRLVVALKPGRDDA
jgi:hypothetical protein